MVTSSAKSGLLSKGMKIQHNCFIYLFIYRHDDNTIFYASVYRAKHVQKGAYMDQADKKKIIGEFMGVNFVLKGRNTQKPVQPRGIHDKASSLSLRPHTWPHLI